jgi:hypothetical protein
MAKAEKKKTTRQRICRELIDLGNLLQRNSSDVVLNADVLRAAANQASCSGDSYWGYQIAGLQLRIRTPQNSLPPQTGGSLFVQLDLDVEGKYDEKHCDGDDLLHLVLQICIHTDQKKNFCAWHFDRHIKCDGDEESEEAHPLYHFQHGGHAMEEISDSLGRVLLLPAPRLPSPPMDAILAIDFLLSNFAGKQWKKLRNDPQYLHLLQDAQNRYWKPYHQQLASWWDQGPKNDQTLDLLPHLV